MAYRTPLLVLTHLQTDRGRAFSDALQRQLLESQEQHQWFPCILDLAKYDANALRLKGPRTLVIDCDASDFEAECARLEIVADDVAILITNHSCSRWAQIPILAPHPALTGAVLADRLLRRGNDEFWLIAENPGPDHQILREAFVQELVHAGRKLESLRVHLTSADALTLEATNRPVSVALLDRRCSHTLHETFPAAELADFPRLTHSARPQLMRHAEFTAQQLIKLLASNPRHSRWLPLDTCPTPPPTLTSDPIANQTSQLIDDRLCETQLGPAILAEALDVPRRTLERRFRKALGNSLLQEIQRRKILAAKLFLTGVERSSERAAKACGFKDSRMLNIAFQRFTNSSPRAFLEEFDRVILR